MYLACSTGQIIVYDVYAINTLIASVIRKEEEKNTLIASMFMVVPEVYWHLKFTWVLRN